MFKIKSLLLVACLVVALILPAAPASGAQYFLDAAYCASPLNGTWSTSPETCTIPTGNSGTIASGDTLTIQGNGVNRRILMVKGTLTIDGRLDVEGLGLLEDRGWERRPRVLSPAPSKCTLPAH